MPHTPQKNDLSEVGGDLPLSAEERRRLRREMRHIPAGAQQQDSRAISVLSALAALLLHGSLVAFVLTLPEPERSTPIGSRAAVGLSFVEVIQRPAEPEPEDDPEPPKEAVEIEEPPVIQRVELTRAAVIPPPQTRRPGVSRAKPAKPVKQRRKVVKQARQEAPPSVAAAPQKAPGVQPITSPATSPSTNAEGGTPADGPPEGAVVDPNAAKESYAGANHGSSDSGEAVGDPDAPPEVDMDALLRGYMGSVVKSVHRGYRYPRAAARAGLEGNVLVEVIIDATGQIVKTRILRSSGHPVLDQAALRAISSIGRVPAPPKALGWSRRSMQVPFEYRLQRG